MGANREKDSIISIRDYLENTSRPHYSEAEEMVAQMLKNESFQQKQKQASPDTFGADCLFLEYFLTPDMVDDFPVIARNFFVHEISSIENEKQVDYLEGVSGNVTSSQKLEQYTLNLMMNSLKSGSEYTRKLFQYLYKTYYRKEYRQLKRFSKLSRTELLDLSTSSQGNISPTLLAVNLTMAQVFGIEIQPGCNDIYRNLNQYYAQRQDPQEADWKFMEDVLETEDESKAEIQTLFANSEEMIGLETEYGRFLEDALRSKGYPKDFVPYCNSDDWGIEDRLIKTRSVLKKTYPDRKFSKEELIAYAGIYEVMSALICSTEETGDWLYELTNRGQVEDHLPEFDPKDVSQGDGSEASPNAEKADQEPKNKGEELLREIEELQKKVHKQEGSIKSLRAKLAGHRKLEEEKAKLIEQMDEERAELEALRWHVYQLTEEDEPTSEVSLMVMREALAKKRIVIVGGHSNWKQKLRKLFEKWVFIDPNAVGAVDPDVVAKADFVYFFTDTLSHKTYYRYIHAAREKRVKFGYLHGVNVEKTVREIYREVVE